MMGRFYELKFDMDTAEDGSTSWLVTVPAFPEITTFGDDKSQAFNQGGRAIEEAISARIANGDDIPHPLDKDEMQWGVELPLMSYFKCALYMLCRANDISRAELQRRLGWHREQVDRLFRIDHKSQLDQIEAAFKAIDVPISVDIPLPEAA